MRRVLAGSLAAVVAAALASGCTASSSSSPSGGGTGGGTGDAPLLFEDFASTDFSGTTSTDGVWRINGPWVATGSNYFVPANAQLVDSYNGESGGYLLLTVVATSNTYGGSCSGTTGNSCQGAEIQTNGTTAIGSSSYTGSNLRYGYYEVRMKVTSTPGVCVSFFWIGDGYGPGEIDYEFLTDESWASDPGEDGAVHISIHDTSSTSTKVALSFNPTDGFHRYGFLWTPTQLVFLADRKEIFTSTDPPDSVDEGGYIMMNAWTGNANWGGGPPTSNATSAYDWVKYWPDVTSVPDE